MLMLLLSTIVYEAGQVSLSRKVAVVAVHMITD
jgi:hypothetical protein